MARSLVSQMKSVWSASQILAAGASRFEEKRTARTQLARLGKGATSARMAESTRITSYRAYDLYKGVSVDFARFLEASGVKQVADIRPAHAEAFLRAKMVSGASCNTMRTIAAALGKLDAALSRCPKKMHIPAEVCLKDGIEAARRDFNATAPRLDTTRRAYAGPARLVETVKVSAHRLAAELQFKAGFRISEVQGITRADLLGVMRDPVTGALAGRVHVHGKGGFERVQFVPLATYRVLQEALAKDVNALRFGYGSYLRALRSACHVTGEAYSGSHGLRHNYIQAFVLSAAESGNLSMRGIQREAMERVGHHRESELATYFR